jgi:spermidine/putrescine transport system substrate-binding protein
MDRRDFLRRAGGAAIAVPSLAAILAACAKPGTTSAGGGSGSSSSVGEIPIANPDNPVTLPMTRDPIPTDTPIEAGATLQVYNWDAYMYKKVLAAFEDQYNVKIEWTTFNNQEEGIQKLVAGQVKPDVFFSTTDYIRRLVATDHLQPLNYELLPNLAANVWPVFSDPGPWYDLGPHYTIPYTIYTTGVAYRRDRLDDAEAASMGYETFFDARFKDAVSYYDSYRDALGMMLLRNGVTNPDSDVPADINGAKDAIMQLVNDNGARLTINGAFAKLPEGEYTVAQSWSGDIVGAKYYLPKGTPESVLGYWYPDDNKGLIGSDTITIPVDAPHPRLAHEFLNFFLDEKWGYENFAGWNGYQPPFTSIVPDRLISEGVVPPALSRAVLGEENFTQGYLQSELTPETDALWLAAWNEITAGG